MATATATATDHDTARAGGAAVYGATDLARLLGLSLTRIYALHRSGYLPRATQIGPRRMVWPRDTFDAWLREPRPLVGALAGAGAPDPVAG